MSEYKSEKNWINNAPLTIVDISALISLCVAPFTAFNSCTARFI